MTTLVESGNKTQPGELAGHEIPYSLTLLADGARKKVEWLTDAELEAHWRCDELATPVGALLTPAEFALYPGGNGGDEPFIPINIVRGYD